MNEEVDYEEDIDPAAAAAAAPVVEDRRSRGGGGGTADEIKRKGRGHNQINHEDRSFQNNRVFENIQRGKGSGPLQC
jgi:hypothetical protein